MNSIICFLAVLSVVAAMPQAPSRLLRRQATPIAAQAAPAPAATPAAAPRAGPPPLGPNFFGPGLNNPLARPTNAHQVRIAQQVFKTNPNVRAFVEVDGQVTFTDQFGREVEVVDSFGGNPLEMLDPEEMFERQQKQARQNLLRSFLQGGTQTPGAAGTASGGATNRFANLAGLEAFGDFEEFAELAALRNFRNSLATGAGRAQNGNNAFFVQ